MNKMELLNPTDKFASFVFRSANYLNSPKFIFNYWLDSFYRQFINQGDPIKEICEFLKQCKYSSPLQAAKKFVEQRQKISTEEFDSINVNSYIDNEPDSIKRRSEHIDAYYKRNTEEVWRHGHLIYKTVKSFPFAKEFK